MAAEYSYSELMQMQDKAIERVRQMQERARRTMEENPIELPHTSPEQAEAEAEKEPPSEEIPVIKKEKPCDSMTGGFKINSDKDRATILPLLLLLMNEGADNLLLLALIYIMA